MLPDLPGEPDGIAARLLAAGIEVEEITPLEALLRPVVVGRVVAVEPHPNADRLRLCRVDVGEEQPLQIVTGAPNVRPDASYPVVRIGTTLPGGTRIRKGKLRGELSEGMLGSASELELGGDSEGLLELEGTPRPGTPLPEAITVGGFMIRIAAVKDQEELLRMLEGGAARELQIDIFADIACPWCYIAEKRLEVALRDRGLDVVWRWRPFQLQPGLPAAGLPWAEFVAGKFGADAAAIFDHVTTTGREDGVEFHFDRITRAPNTADAHRLVLFAAERGLARRAAHELFAEYFTRGNDIGDAAVLERIATRLEIPAAEARAFLAGDGGREAVAASQDVAARLGITGVPFFIFNGRTAVSGAQDSATFTRAIDMSFEEGERQPS
jgi:predicted DsbA family dithiol-disulfide isomerase/tRNA-binding EMAP/Myf-like protein